MLRIPSRARVIGGEKARRTEEIVHLAQIGRAAEDVVPRLERVVAKTVAKAQFRPGAGHDLHQTQCSGGRDGGHPTRTFDLHHGADPVLGNAEPLRRFGNMVGIGLHGRTLKGDILGMRRDWHGSANKQSGK